MHLVHVRFRSIQPTEHCSITAQALPGPVMKSQKWALRLSGWESGHLAQLLLQIFGDGLVGSLYGNSWHTTKDLAGMNENPVIPDGVEIVLGQCF